MGKDDPFADEREARVRRERRLAAEMTRIARRVVAADRERVRQLTAAAAVADDTLRTVSDALLTVAGYHKHHRGEWRMKRQIEQIAKLVADFEERMKRPEPMVRCSAPKEDAEAVAVYAQARAGDAEAQRRVVELIRQRGWVEWVGDLGRQATRELIGRATGGDAVWRAGVEERVRELSEELLGPNPSVLEELLVRRVVNGWVSVHALELEAATRPPAERRNKGYLDAAVSRGQKRMTQAVGELARVRRLHAPRVVATLTVVTPDPPPALPSLEKR